MAASLSSFVHLFPFRTGRDVTSAFNFSEMSKAGSITRFGADMEHLYDPHFTADISEKMRVPKRIRVNGSAVAEEQPAPTPAHCLDMQVPDRILVIGQDQHLGTKAPPRELVLENSVMLRDPGMVRVQTPPRVITLDNHYFPSADDFVPEQPNPDPPEEKLVVVPRNKQRVVAEKKFHRESTPPLAIVGDGLTPAEEIVHLRRQMAKLNRRIMAVELDNLQRQQREKVLFALGLAYFFVKALLWVSRSS